MSRKKYVLWIEDDATYNLQYIASPIVMNPKYDLTLAVTVSEAINFLERREYDAIIFDLRLPPGRQKDCIKLYKELAKSQEPSRLGLHLLLNLFGMPVNAKYRLSMPDFPFDFSVDKIGILSVDDWDDVAELLRGIGICEPIQYKRKRAGMPSNTLLNLVETVVL